MALLPPLSSFLCPFIIFKYLLLSRGSSVFKNTSFSTSHSQVLAPAFWATEVTWAEWHSRLLRLWYSTQHPRVHTPPRPLFSHPKLASHSRILLSRGRFTAGLNWEFFGARAFGEELRIILEHERNLLAVFLMQGQCLLYQTGNSEADRTLPILYSSPH